MKRTRFIASMLKARKRPLPLFKTRADLVSEFEETLRVPLVKEKPAHVPTQAQVEAVVKSRGKESAEHLAYQFQLTGDVRLLHRLFDLNQKMISGQFYVHFGGRNQRIENRQAFFDNVRRYTVRSVFLAARSYVHGKSNLPSKKQKLFSSWVGDYLRGRYYHLLDKWTRLKRVKSVRESKPPSASERIIDAQLEEILPLVEKLGGEKVIPVFLKGRLLDVYRLRFEKRKKWPEIRDALKLNSTSHAQQQYGKIKSALLSAVERWQQLKTA